MIELKYLKDLPVRPLNENKTYLKVTGGDIYVDKDGNRYAYLSFKNSYKKPVFSLYLVVKEYDLNGTLIRENHQAYPSIYIGKQSYITEKPIKLTRDCEGLDVYIAYAEFSNIYFYEDKVQRSNPKCIDEISPEAYLNIPATVGHATLNFIKEVPAQPVEEEKGPSNEAAKEESAVKQSTVKDTEVQTESTSEPVVKEEAAKEEVVDENLKGFAIRRGLKFNPAALVALGIAAVILLLALAIALKFTK